MRPEHQRLEHPGADDAIVAGDPAQRLHVHAVGEERLDRRHVDVLAPASRAAVEAPVAPLRMAVADAGHEEVEDRFETGDDRLAGRSVGRRPPVERDCEPGRVPRARPPGDLVVDARCLLDRTRLDRAVADRSDDPTGMPAAAVGVLVHVEPDAQVGEVHRRPQPVEAGAQRRGRAGRPFADGPHAPRSVAGAEHLVAADRPHDAVDLDPSLPRAPLGHAGVVEHGLRPEHEGEARLLRRCGAHAEHEIGGDTVLGCAHGDPDHLERFDDLYRDRADLVGVSPLGRGQRGGEHAHLTFGRADPDDAERRVVDLAVRVQPHRHAEEHRACGVVAVEEVPVVVVEVSRRGMGDRLARLVDRVVVEGREHGVDRSGDGPPCRSAHPGRRSPPARSTELDGLSSRRLEPMPRRQLSLAAYRRMTGTALVMVSAIIVTGAAVRLTDSGLGCPDWPNCARGRLVQVTNAHQAVEQINRLFTGAMTVALIVTVLGAFRLAERRQDLRRLSLALVVGVVAQAVLGGVVVLTHLHPLAVQQHYNLSIVIVTAAVVLHRRAREASGERAATVPTAIVRHTRVLVAFTALALLAGTIVTGAGPHSGHAPNDPTKVRRFDIAITTAARVHSSVVWLAMLTALGLAWRMRGQRWRPALDDALSLFLLAGLTQGAIGYTQYALGVPAGLVEIHVLGSVLVWIAAVRLLLACRRPVDGAVSAVARTEPIGSVVAGS